MANTLTPIDKTQGITRWTTINVMINGTQSDPINTEGFSLAGIFYPAGMSSAQWTFDVSWDGVTWFALNNNSPTDAARYSVIVGATAAAIAFGTFLYPWPWIRINTNASETAVQLMCSVFPLR